MNPIRRSHTWRMLVRQMPSYLLSAFDRVKVGGRRPMALLSDALPPHLISRPAVHLTYARLGIYQFTSALQSCGRGRQGWINLTMRRSPRVNQEVLLRATFLG